MGVLPPFFRKAFPSLPQCVSSTLLPQTFSGPREAEGQHDEGDGHAEHDGGKRVDVRLHAEPHHCKGCHNPTTHPFDGGRMVSPDWVFADVRKNPIVRGVTFSGGEPFVQSGKLAPLAERLRAAGYNLTSYTGYLYEELLADSRHMPLLRQLDILVDGPFILEEKSLIIRFRGSRNQRIIDVPRSLAEGRVVLHPAMD